MSILLPKPIMEYFAAEKSDAANFVKCFTDNAVVKDNHETYTGSTEIFAWKNNFSSKYTFTSTPISITEESGKFIVICHVVGNFSGSPIDMQYIFQLSDDLISSLEILA